MTYTAFVEACENLAPGRDLERWLEDAEERLRTDYDEILALVESTGYEQVSGAEVDWGLSGLEWYLEGLDFLREGSVARALECAGQADHCLRAACRANREFRQTVRFEAVG